MTAARGHRLSQVQVGQKLRTWQERMEEQARLREWEYPMGFGPGKPWPPFEIVEATIT